MGVDQERHDTASKRRNLAIRVFRTELDKNIKSSAAARLAAAIESGGRGLIVGGDTDGLVSASMLASVAPDWDIIGIVVDSQWLLLHPTALEEKRERLFGVDVFSPVIDNVSNHVVLWGSRALKGSPAVLKAFRLWDQTVQQAAAERLFAVPAIWAGTQASRDDYGVETSSRYKYPLGAAQVLLALLESCGRPPRFFDREYLPWLVANCDGGIRSFSEYRWNVGTWWPVMAAAVGPASLTEHVFDRVRTMRPHDFTDVVNKLDREGGPRGKSGNRLLNDQWNLADTTHDGIRGFLEWLVDLTGWRDPVRGGIPAMKSWIRLDVPTQLRGSVPIDPKHLANNDKSEAQRLHGALGAINANFQHWAEGDRFSWVGGWPSLAEGLPPLNGVGSRSLSGAGDESV